MLTENPMYIFSVNLESWVQIKDDNFGKNSSFLACIFGLCESVCILARMRQYEYLLKESRELAIAPHPNAKILPN